MIFSCSNKKQEDQIKAIDVMNSKLEKFESKLDANKIDTIAGLKVATTSLFLRIQNNYYSKKIDLTFGKKMDEFKELSEIIVPDLDGGVNHEKTLDRRFLDIKKSISEEKKTLKLLKADIENGHGKKEQYDEFIIYEQRKVNLIGELLKVYMNYKEKQFPRFLSLYKHLDEIAKDLEKKNATKKPTKK
ncbi:MAG: hypothetical protein EBQ94_11870 [Flavobacteriales bacterium]|nr:hypothetical protein [Flavobacteriales bacterium]NCA20611.1 hypothetical protein [Crocinitomicaceae bacterium]